jgi:DNA-binding NtrC family response regulator
VGDTKSTFAEFQVITASTRDLDDEVDAGRFLLDLRMRLTGVDFHLPPLRERMGDLPALVALLFAREGIALPPNEVEKIAVL